MENLKALVYKGDLTPYQMALAQKEFKDMVERLELLEKAVKNCSIPAVVGQSEQFYCNCSRGRGLDYDEDGMPYCIECQKPVQ